MRGTAAVFGCCIALVLAGMACSTVPAKTDLIEVWKDKSYVSTARKIAVFWIDQDAPRRIIIENDIMRQLKARGIDVLPMYVIIPPDKMVEKEEALNKIKNLGAGAILTMRFIDKYTLQSDIGKDGGAGPGYYRYVYDSPPRESSDSAYIESIFFDLGTGQRTWVARSESKIEVASPEAASAVVKTLLDQLAKDKMIK